MLQRIFALIFLSLPLLLWGQEGKDVVYTGELYDSETVVCTDQCGNKHYIRITKDGDSYSPNAYLRGVDIHSNDSDKLLDLVLPYSVSVEIDASMHTFVVDSFAISMSHIPIRSLSVVKPIRGNLPSFRMNSRTSPLKSVYIAAGTVNSIADLTFFNCVLLQSVEIHSSLESIGDKAFWGCSSLESINIPPSVASIGAGAFFGCSSLESINIPPLVTSISSSAFEGCNSLKSINIPPSVTSIGDNAFTGCKIRSIEIPGSNCYIGEYAFSRSIYDGAPNTALESVVLSGSVKKIAGSAFYNCAALKSITIQSVDTIENYAFSDCSALESIILPSVNYIGRHAFDDCTALKSVEISGSDCYIGEKVCDGTALESIIFSGTVKTIEAFAFANITSLKSIDIPSVETIGDYAFSGCTNLRTVTISGSDLSINRYAFSDYDYYDPDYGTLRTHYDACTALESVVISGYVKDINNGAFADCVALKTVDIQSVGIINNSAFKGCTALESAVIDSVGIIFDSAFSGCSSLKSINIPHVAKTICWNAFNDCSALESVAINSKDTAEPGNILISGPVTVEKTVFPGCPLLKHLTIAGSVTLNGSFKDSNLESVRITSDAKSVTIGDYAFANCHSLADFNNEGRVISVGSNAFSECSSLKSVKLRHVTKTGIGSNAFYKCTALESIDVYGSIGSWAFAECHTLKSANIESCGSIGYAAFYNCSSLESFVIPESVEKIGFGAFFGCYSLHSLYAYSECTQLTRDNNYYETNIGLGCYYYNDSIAYENDFGYVPKGDWHSTTLYSDSHSGYKYWDYDASDCFAIEDLYYPEISGNNFTDMTEYFLETDMFEYCNGFKIIKPLPEDSIAINPEDSVTINPDDSITINPEDSVTITPEDSITINPDDSISANLDVTFSESAFGLYADHGMIHIDDHDYVLVEVYDIMGRPVYSGYDVDIPVSNAGVYIVRRKGISLKIVVP